MRLDLRGGEGDDGGGPLEGMIEVLVAGSRAPPKEVKGVSQGFLDGEFVEKAGGLLAWSSRQFRSHPGACGPVPKRTLKDFHG